MATGSKRNRQRPPIRLPLWAIALISLFVLALVIGSSVWLFTTVKSLASDWEVTPPEFGEVAEPTPNPLIVVTDNDDGTTTESSPLNTVGLEKWSGKDRISILLLGIDLRCGEEGPTHTDSMMVLTIDPVGLSGAMLSLPRDLWVEIPGFGLDRINQAHYMGQVYEYPGGGPGLAVETVESVLGIDIDYYAAINFQAFIDVVDAVDGIEVDVPEVIDDPDYPDNCYGYDPLYIDAGTHQLDGAMALKYARTRATFGGDVDRAGRQQAVLLAIREKVLSVGKLPQLLGKAPVLWQSLQDNVRTNMTLDEAVQLALLVQDIPQGSIATAVIDYDYVYNETTPDGRQVLVPNREAIRELRDELFMPPAIPTPVVENLPALAADEEARVAVYNGTAVFGLAAATQEYLQEVGINVVEIGNADSATYRTTQIITYGDFPFTAQRLTQVMAVPPLNISTGTEATENYDILVIIGDDWRVPE